jgi:hypothetical protein
MTCLQAAFFTDTPVKRVTEQNKKTRAKKKKRTGLGSNGKYKARGTSKKFGLAEFTWNTEDDYQLLACGIQQEAGDA